MMKPIVVPSQIDIGAKEPQPAQQGRTPLAAELIALLCAAGIDCAQVKGDPEAQFPDAYFSRAITQSSVN